MSWLRLQVLGLLLVAAACGASQRPGLKVLGIEHTEQAYDGRQLKLFVEVTNYAHRPMHLERFEYVFAAAGASAASRGKVELSRTIEAGSALVVEVPILVDPDLLDVRGLELHGELITEQDQIRKAYPVSSVVAQPSRAAPAP